MKQTSFAVSVLCLIIVSSYIFHPLHDKGGEKMRLRELVISEKDAKRLEKVLRPNTVTTASATAHREIEVQSEPKKITPPDPVTTQMTQVQKPETETKIAPNKKTVTVVAQNRAVTVKTSLDSCKDLVRQVVDAEHSPAAVELVMTVIEMESGCNPTAIGASGEKGLMQIMSSTAKIIGCHHDLFHPIENIRCGVKYLQHLQVRHARNDVRSLFIAYNGGPGPTGNNPMSRRYSDKGLAIYARRLRMLQQQYNSESASM